VYIHYIVNIHVSFAVFTVAFQSKKQNRSCDCCQQLHSCLLSVCALFSLHKAIVLTVVVFGQP